MATLARIFRAWRGDMPGGRFDWGIPEPQGRCTVAKRISGNGWRGHLDRTPDITGEFNVSTWWWSVCRREEGRHNEAAGTLERLHSLSGDEGVGAEPSSK